MFNFSAIPKESVKGRLLRLPLRLIPENLAIPVWQGKLRGRRWIVGSGSHGYWLGSFEYEKQRLISEAVRPGTVFFDVGAHAGFYSMLASSLVGKSGRVFAFEPLPKNAGYLRKHIRMNRIPNVTLIEAAVSDRSGEARFREGGSSFTGSIDSGGPLVVEQVSLDDLVWQREIPLPDYIKIDVEGAERMVLQGARELLSVASPTLFLATHSNEVHSDCLGLLQSIGYTCRPLDGSQDLERCNEVLATKERLTGTDGNSLSAHSAMAARA
jgi:FkbM family methyltransferase